MKTYFYSHLIETTTISLKLGDLEMNSEERAHLMLIAQSNIHHVVLDTVLSELTKEDKKIFLSLFSENNHPKIWAFLNVKTENLEDKIKKASKKVIQELHKDIDALKSE